MSRLGWPSLASVWVCVGSQRENKDDLFPGLGTELWGKENSFRFGDPSQRKRSPTTVSLVSPKTGIEFLGTAWGLYCMKRNPVMVRVEGGGWRSRGWRSWDLILLLWGVGKGVSQTWVRISALSLPGSVALGK